MLNLIPKIFLMLCLLFVFSGVRNLEKKDRFSEIQYAFDSENWVQTEALLKQYLQTETDLELNWYAWLMLLKVGEHLPVFYDVSESYLMDMYTDYANDAEKKKFIVMRLAQLKIEEGDIDSAISAWEEYLGLDGVRPQEAYVVQRKLIDWYFRLGDVGDMERVLYDCLTLEINEQDSAFCLYNLADLKAGREDWETTEELLLQALSINADSYIKAQSAFLYGDVLETQGKYEQALEYFQLAKQNYGNEEVVQMRIDYLQEKID